MTKRGEADAAAPKLSLTDRLARQIRGLIRQGNLAPGDRLPAIMQLARRFRVGHPAVREALKALETLGVVEIRHGSGVYVARADEVLLIAGPHHATTFTKQLLLDLVRTRRPLEMESVAAAVERATAEDLVAMRELLDGAGQHVTDEDAVYRVGLAFHRLVSVASGNTVLIQTLEVLRDLFGGQQRAVLGMVVSREEDHREHLGILEALERRDAALAVGRMRDHLAGVEGAVRRWDPDRHPVT